MANITPKKAIANFCKECVCGDREEIRNCTALNCPLYDFRPYKGTSTKTTVKSADKAERGKKVMTEEHKAKMKASKAAKKADRLAGAPVEPAKPTPVVKTTKKAEAARARMTPEHKAKMKAGRLAKKAGIAPTTTAKPVKSLTKPETVATSKLAGMRRFRSPEDAR